MVTDQFSISIQEPQKPILFYDLFEFDEYFSDFSSSRLLSRLRIASDPKSSPQLLEQLSYDKNFKVRSCVAANVKCPIYLLERLSFDEEFWVRCEVAANFNCPPDVLVRLSQDPHKFVRSIVAGRLVNGNWSSDVFISIALHGHSEVVEELLKLKSLPLEIVHAPFEGKEESNF